MLLRDLRLVFVELTVPQRDEHRFVLIAHHLLDAIFHVGGRHDVVVARLFGRDDASTIRKQVRDDVRVLDSRILSLDVVELALVTNVGVVPEKGRCHRGTMLSRPPAGKAFAASK